MSEIAQFTQKYQTMTRAHSRGAQDGNKNLPSSNENRPSQAELEIIQLAQDDMTKYANRQMDENDATQEDLRTWKSELSNIPLPSLDAFRSKADLELNKAERELLRLYGNVLARQQEYRFFKIMNRLNRDSYPPSSLFVTTCWLIFVIVIDGAINAYFFKDTSPYALVGGFLFAGLISLFNTLAGFSAGLIPWRYLQHRKRLHLIWAFPLLVIFLTIIGGFNLAVGHYRDLLALNKDVLPEQAISELIVSPLGLQSIQSFLLTGIGIAIAMLAARKGYTFLDSYPAYGRYFARKENANDLFEERLTALQKDINEIANQFLESAKSQHQRANKIIQEAIGAVQDAISRNERFAEIVEGIEKACDAAVRIYRDANIQVRDRVRYPEPRYFSEFIKLPKPSGVVDLNSFGLIKKELDVINEKMKAEFEVLCQSIPIQARQMLSESALNERLDKIKEAARRAEQEVSVGAS